LLTKGQHSPSAAGFRARFHGGYLAQTDTSERKPSSNDWTVEPAIFVVKASIS